MPNHCEFRFYEELNDFLAPGLRKRSFAYAFNGTPAVKDPIEALGVPHTEVDLILDPLVVGNDCFGDVDAQLALGAHHGDPELALEQHASTRRPDFHHPAARIAIGEHIGDQIVVVRACGARLWSR